MNRLNLLQQQIATANRNQAKPASFADYRRMSTINGQELKQRLYGPNWKERDNMMNIVKANPQIYPHFFLNEATREQYREKSAEMLFHSKRLVNMDYEEYLKDPNKLTLISNGVIPYDHGFSVKNGVHIFLYMKTIFNLGRERHKKFIDNAISYKDIGCFGLTELLHGSNVKGLMTEAHYDHRTKQFIINSPSKQAMKFWIGAAAQVANMSVVWAQLYIDGKCHGVHAYIVPIRDRHTHKLLPGVLIGDCGPKMGNQGIDNGFMLFDNVRIPFDNQLDRISGVDENGKFFSIIEGEEKRFGIQLGALSGGRFMISLNCTAISLAAITIAVRYCCVRRQFSDSPQKQQNLLLDYPLTRRRLMPLLAQTIIYTNGNMQITRVWDQNYMNILNPENTIIQQLHGISSVIKPKSGWFSTQVLKECRQMLGGHGYSAYSKLGTLYNDNDVNNTWEGDNNVLIQQATKYILDNAQKMMKGKQIESEVLAFLTEPPSESDVKVEQKNFMDLNWCKKFLQFCLNDKLQDMGMKMLGMKQQKMGNMDIWNNSQVFLGKTLALIMGDLFYLQSAVKKLASFTHEPTRAVFLVVIQLWLLKILRESEYIDSIHHASIQRLMLKLSDQLSGESLGILEAISTCDRVIGSPFACPEGKGFDKYVQIVRARGKENERPQWWRLITDRSP